MLKYFFCCMLIASPVLADNDPGYDQRMRDKENQMYHQEMLRQNFEEQQQKRREEHIEDMHRRNHPKDCD